MLSHSLDVAPTFTDRVLVSYSGGKDSVATLDLCCRKFKHVQAFFMYLVDGMSFNEAAFQWVKDRYGIDVVKIPHPMLAEWLRYGTFRNPDMTVPLISFKDVYNYVRAKTGIYWIAAGERIADSIVRRAMIKNSGTIDHVRGRLFPVAEWTKADVVAYVKQRKLMVSPESKTLGFSFRSLMPSDMDKISKVYPADYKKIRSWFPMVDASVMRHRYQNESN